jgi:hypothetical protein
MMGVGRTQYATKAMLGHHKSSALGMGKATGKASTSKPVLPMPVSNQGVA